MMKRQDPKFETPLRPWVKETIEAENEIRNEYGLRRKKEIWRAEAVLRGWRRRARELAASRNAEEEKILLAKLCKMGLIGANANLDDVLGLEMRNLLDRRLQTLVFKRGFAHSAKQARQFIVHGHIAVGGVKIAWPSMIVPAALEGEINFYDRSKVKAWLMAAKAKQVEKEKAAVGKAEKKESKPEKKEHK